MVFAQRLAACIKELTPSASVLTSNPNDEKCAQKLPDDPRKAAKRERRVIYARVNSMERALASIYLACSELSPKEKLTVLQAAITEGVREYDAEQRTRPIKAS